MAATAPATKDTSIALATDLTPITTTQTAIALIPGTLDGAFQLAGWLATSSFLPEKLRGKPGDIFSIILAGVELGLPPMAALRGIYIVNGKTAMEGRTKAAVCLQRGAALFIRRTEYTPIATTWTTQRRGHVDPVHMRFTQAEAKAAGLTGKEGPWRNYEQRMISHRALGWLLDDVYPDILMGVATAEDFDDVDSPVFQAIGKVGGVEVGAAPASKPSPPPITGAPSTAKAVTSEVVDAKPGPSAMTDDEANQLEKEIVQFRDKKGLQAMMGKKIAPREMSQETRARLQKACGDQIALINEAIKADADAAKAASEGGGS